MSGLVKAVFKPIKKIWKGIKKVASKVWDKIKKPLMVAAGLYLTAGLGASFMTGSLASGFGSVNSAIGGFFGAGGETAIAGETINSSVATGMAEATANTTLTAGELAGGVSSGAAGSTVSGATAAGMEASLANGFTAESLASAATSGGTATAGGSAGGSLLANAATEGAKQAASNFSMGADTLSKGYQAVDTASKVAPKAGLFDSVGKAASNVMDGNWAEAGSNALDAVSSGAGKVWDAATGTTGSALLTSNLLQGYSQYEQAKDMEDRWKRRSYWGMNGYGNTASTPERQAPQPRGAIAPTTIDDLIRQSRGG